MKVRKVLWTYKPNKDGTCMVRIYAYHNGKKRYFHTGVSVAPTDWNPKTNEVRKSHPLAKRYNARINGRRNDIEAHLLDGGSLANVDEGHDSFMDYILSTLQRFDYTFI